MKKLFSIKCIVLFLSIFLTLGSIKAQDSHYTVALDTNMIVIGDQINLVFKAVVPNDVNVEFPILKDTIVKGLEIISVGKLESKPLKNNLKELLIKYKITAFDTGLYVIPVFPIRILSKGFDKVIRTEELQLGVSTFKVDTSKEYADIMAPKEAPINFAEIMPYLLWILLGGLLVVLIYIYIKKWRAKESIFKFTEKPKEPAHIIAFRNLDKIKQEKLWENNKIKDFHSQLTEVIRVYIEDQFAIKAMEETTIEIIKDVKKEPLLNTSIVEKLEDILYRADFVKFAKAIPLGNENQQSLDNAYKIVSLSYKELVNKAESDRLNQEENLDN